MRVDLSSVALGAISVLIVLLSSGMQASARSSAVVGGSTWPPPARDQVSFANYGLTVPHNGTPLALVNVPGDKYLVITRMRFTTGSGPGSWGNAVPVHVYGNGGIRYAGQHQFEDPINQLDHRLMGQGDSIGLSFAPGSTISILADFASDIPNVSYTLMGYYQDP